MADEGDDAAQQARALRDARRRAEQAASRERQRAAYRAAQQQSRQRAVRAAEVPASRPGEPQPDEVDRAESAVEQAQRQLEEAELQQALLAALAALPTAQRVAVVAALGYDEGAVGAALELDLDVAQAQVHTEEGLAALRAALAGFLSDG